jgi:hypothetical protein
MRTNIQTTLPKYSPQPAETKPAESSVGQPAPLSDDPAIRFPDFHVVGERGPAHDPDNWFTKEGLEQKALKEYRDSMNSVEWALNRFYIPLPFGFSLTPSPLARATAKYKDKKIADEVSRLTDLVSAVAELDSVEGKKLSRDLDLSRHPGD